MIRHTVVFRLRHDAGSAAEADFLASAKPAAGSTPPTAVMPPGEEAAPDTDLPPGEEDEE